MNKLRTSSRYFINAVLCAVLWSIMCYCCIAFYSWEISPAKWSEGERMVFVLFGVVIGCTVGWAYFDYSVEKSERIAS